MGIRPGTEGANAITEEWAGEIMLKPNEEGILASKCTEPFEVSQHGDTYHVSILPVIAAQTLASTDQGSGAGIVYHAGTILEATASGTFAYGIVAIPDHMLTKLSSERGGALKAGYRKQLLASLAVKQDQVIAALATAISTQLGLPSNFDQSGLLSSKGTLVTNAKEFVNFNSGDPNINLVYHPSQMQYVDAIPGITHAYARGDKASPTVKGVVHDAWGMTFSETGLVYVAANVAYNPIFTKEAWFIAFPQKAVLKAEQEFEFETRIPAKIEFAPGELFDEAAVIWRSPV